MANQFPEGLNTHKKDWSNTTPVKDTHPEEHNDIAGAVEALEAKVGIDGSADHDSHDYKLSSIAGSDKAASKTTTDAHAADTDNPHEVTKSQVGLGSVDNTSDAEKNAAEATLTNKTINADNNTISNLEVDNFKANVVDTDDTLATDSDSRIPTQKAIKKYVDDKVGEGGGVAPIIETFTTSGTWNKPVGAQLVRVIVYGAGGGGAGGNGNNNNNTGGGGGGARVERELLASDLDSSVAITVGVGGAGGSAGGAHGSDGGNSSFGSYILAGGGDGGHFNDGSGGLGGTAGDIGALRSSDGQGRAGAGGNGGTSSAGPGSADGGGGGGGRFGGYGGITPAATSSGANGNMYFGGAGGSNSDGGIPAGGGGTPSSNASGFAGGRGEVIVITFF